LRRAAVREWPPAVFGSERPGPPIWKRTPRAARARVAGYAIAGAAATATIGPWLVLVLLACDAIELAWRRASEDQAGLYAWPAVVAAVPAVGGFAALAWTAFKVGAVSFSGGFVIIPLMQGDAVETYHWTTDGQRLNAVALGQVTPGPVVATLAASTTPPTASPAACSPPSSPSRPRPPSSSSVQNRFERLIANPSAQRFLAGAAPAAVGAIVRPAIPLTLTRDETRQLPVLAGGAALLFVLRRGVVATLPLAGAAGSAAALAGAALPHTDRRRLPNTPGHAGPRARAAIRWTAASTASYPVSESMPSPYIGTPAPTRRQQATPSGWSPTGHEPRVAS
jgi:chromate transporter